MLEKLHKLHEVIDRFFDALGLRDDPEVQRRPEVLHWRGRWRADCDAVFEAFTQQVGEQPQLAVSRLPTGTIAEILAIMKFELVYHKDKLTDGHAKLLRKTFSRVLQASDVHVPKISAFFIPSMEVEFGDDCAVVGVAKGCEIKRGVYDRETRLIAQYLSADDQHARKLFWAATEIWHGFEHPNLAKMVGESLVEAKPLVVWEDVDAQGDFIHYFGVNENQKRLWRMFLEAGRGLNYIHQQGKAHGSLKCSHILVSKHGTPKICHFELSKGSNVGAFDRWKGPEYNLGTGLDPSAAGDIYAFGLCIIEARTGIIPYDTDCDDTVKRQLEEGNCYPRPEVMRDDEWNVVKRFVVHNPNERATMAQGIEMMEELAKKEALEEEHIDHENGKALPYQNDTN
ncbi:unnamed protein product [Phytophthora fragariaefolia]|uniref:Unnamed protein product n=1 Tax=Phytophthora fragariaefolia TaxID=1490495 RepID=A0A9W6X6C4_9STRA|nr:unnamed protein product [Phytophthora fragariaefolia]